MDPAPQVLLLMDGKQRVSLARQLGACGAEVLGASDCAEALRILQTGASPQIVLTTPELPDGDWRRVRRALGQAKLKAPIVLCVPHMGSDWSELLEAGAHDLLIAPYERDAIQELLDATAQAPRRRWPSSEETHRSTARRSPIALS